ncbi:MAG TPA: polysaccharide biosynthesis/export family protein [Saprospiraceae bacterium]|nr:polysaccharide biosynthesis/export family protein [Saprospiraceae bacterium]
MRNCTPTPLLAALVFASIAILSSCSAVKHEEMLMLQNVQNQLAAIDTFPALKIQADDILNIQVTSRVQEAIAAFQAQPAQTIAGSGENALGVMEGYRVDEGGNVFLPYLGKMRAAGKTIRQLRQDISNNLVAFIPDATVQVRFVNFRVTMIGEVTRPNAYIIPNEHLNILEAVGMAGDFTSYAKRNNVLVIRERNQVREFGRINTQDSTLFVSPYFYLRPNDVVYVEPLKAKQYAIQGDFLNRYSPVILPIVTLATFFIGIAVAR